MSCTMRCLLGLVFTMNFCFGLELDDKSKKMFSVLEKKTESEFIFERFYNLFLEANLATDLEAFLEIKYETTSDKKYLQLKASFYLRECENLKAIEIYNQLITDQSSAYMYYSRGKAYVSLLKLKPAIEDLTIALTKSPKTRLKVKITKLLGKIYIRQMNVTKGIETLLTIAEDGDDVAYHEIIDLMMAEGLYAEAQVELSKFIKNCKNKQKKVVLMLRQAELFRKQNLKEKSLDSFVATLDHVGSGSWLEKEIFSQLEKVFRSEDDLHGLYKFYSTSLPNKKNNIELLKREATIATEIGKFEAAEQLYKRIVKLTPSNKNNIVDYTRFLIQHGKNSEALAILSDLQQKNPTDGELLVSLANLHFKMDKKAQCAATLKKYNILKNGSEVALTRTATMLFKFEMFSEAKPIYKSLVEISPENKDARLVYAFVLDKLGEKDKALDEYNTLAKSASIEQLQDIITILSKNKQIEASKKIMLNRENELGKSYGYHRLLQSVGMNLNDQKIVHESLLAMVKYADNNEELQEAIYSILAIFGKANKLQELQETLSKEAESVNERLLLAALYEYHGEPAKRIEIINALSTSKNSRLLALQQKLLFAQKSKNDQEAIETLNQLLAVNPKSKIRYYKSLVDFYLKVEDKTNAFATIEKWKIAAPNATTPYISEAAILRSGENPSKAVELIKKVMFRFNKDENLASILVKYLTEDGSYKEAKSIYWNRLDESEKVSDKLACIASLNKLCEEEGSVDELKSLLKARLENNPNSTFILLALANVCGNNDHDGRRYYLTRASEVRSDDLDLLQELARIDEEDGKYGSALAKLKHIYDKKKTVYNKKSLISFYYRNGDNEKANELLTGKGGQKTFTLDEAVSIAESLTYGDTDYLSDFIKPYLQKYPRDYRLLFIQSQIELEQENVYDSLLAILKNCKPAKQTQTNHYISSDHYKSLFSERAFQLLSGMNISNRHWGYHNSRSKPSMPKDEHLAYDYAFSELQKRIFILPPDDQMALFSQLEKVNVYYPELPFIFYNSHKVSNELFNKISDKYSNDNAVQEIMLVARINRRVKTQAELDKIVKEVKLKAPKLTPLLISQYPITKKSGPFINDKELVDGAINLVLESDLSETHYMGQVVIRLVGNETISQDLKMKLFNKVIDAYRKQVASKKHSYYAQGLFSLCAELNKDKELAEIMSSQMTSVGSNMGHYYHHGHHYGSQRPSRVIQKQDFINRILTHDIIRFMNEKMRNVSYGTNDKVYDIQRLKPFVAELEPAVLKLYFAQKLKDDEQCLKAIKQIIADKNATADQMKLCVSWYIEQENYEKVCDTITRIIARTKKVKDKKDLYFSYFFYATKNNNHSLEELKKVINKFRSLRLSIGDKGELLEYLIMMNQFDLAKEFEDDIDAYIMKSRKSNKLRQNYSRSNRDPRQRVYELFENKEKEKAISLAAREIRKLLRPYVVLSVRN